MSALHQQYKKRLRARAMQLSGASILDVMRELGIGKRTAQRWRELDREVEVEINPRVASAPYHRGLALW